MILRHDVVHIPNMVVKIPNMILYAKPKYGVIYTKYEIGLHEVPIPNMVVKIPNMNYKT